MGTIWLVLMVVWIPFISADNLNPDDGEDYIEWLMKKSPDEFRDYQFESMKKDMNFSVDPCEEFYEYSCGNWAENHKQYSSSTQMQDNWNLNFIETVLSRAIQPEDPPGEKKAKLFCKSGKNTEAVNNREPEIVENFVKTLGSFPINDENWSEEDFDWIRVIAVASLYDFPVFFKAGVDEDDDTEAIIVKITKNSDLALDEEIIGERLNFDEVAEITNFTNKLKNLNSETYSDSTKTIPRDSFLRKFLSVIQKEVHIEKLNHLAENAQVFSGLYFQELEDLINATDTRTVANYICFKLYEMVNSLLLPADNTECAYNIHTYMGPMASKILSKYMRGENMKHQVGDMLRLIRKAAQNQLARNDWLDDASKTIALEKLNAIEQIIGIGNPELFEIADKQFEDLDIQEAKYFENQILLRRSYSFTNYPKIGRDVNPEHNSWKGSSESNAYYIIKNHGYIYINIGTMGAPFFHIYSPHYSNYGGLGATLGHEFMHGFDPGQFLHDPKGIKRVWISEWLFLAYLKRSSCFLRQYNKLKVGNSTVDGKKTLEENIADNVGLKIAYDAYVDFLKDHPEEAERDKNYASKMNFSTDQAFFVAFGQSWCSSETLEQEIEFLKGGHPHAPEKKRVIGTIQNSEEFAKAFNCPVGSAMNPPRKCTYL